LQLGLEHIFNRSHRDAKVMPAPGGDLL